jgi:hypothetical protein
LQGRRRLKPIRQVNGRFANHQMRSTRFSSTTRISSRNLQNSTIRLASSQPTSRAEFAEKLKQGPAFGEFVGEETPKKLTGAEIRRKKYEWLMELMKKVT